MPVVFKVTLPVAEIPLMLPTEPMFMALSVLNLKVRLRLEVLPISAAIFVTLFVTVERSTLPNALTARFCTAIFPV